MKAIASQCLWMLLVLAQNRGWAADVASNADPVQVTMLDFNVFWPPTVPAETSSPTATPLLRGCLTTRAEKLGDSSWALRLRTVLTRPADETARQFWNSRLAFPEYDWMRYVRVWDADQSWLWPNLSYLLRLHGTERVERYGGVDPGKGVDNDFAAILIRKYDASAQEESDSTRSAPLVSAEWYPVGVSKTDKHTIVHTVQSDEFTLHAGNTKESRQGQARVWLIFADFMGAKLPDSWPKIPEFAGGILAFFEVKWELKPGAGCKVSIHQSIPAKDTGFDWRSWTTRTRQSPDSKSTSKLSD